MSAVVLLVEQADGNTVGVRFPHRDAARDWEDAQDGTLNVVGCVDLTTRAAALTGGRW